MYSKNPNFDILKRLLKQNLLITLPDASLINTSRSQCFPHVVFTWNAFDWWLSKVVMIQHKILDLCWNLEVNIRVPNIFWVEIINKNVNIPFF